MATRPFLLPLVPLLALLACSEPLLHGLDERQALQVLVALDDAGLQGAARRDEQSQGENVWMVEVRGDVSRARRVLADRELPRPESPGFAAVMGKGSLVPTPGEERARLLQALAGELGRSLEAVDGVVEARVHLAVPPDDPLSGRPPPAPRASVLLRIRPGARAGLEPMAQGLRDVVAGAVIGLEPSRVAVVLAEAASLPRRAPSGSGRLLLQSAAAGAASLGIGLLLVGARRVRINVRWPRLRLPLRPGP